MTHGARILVVDDTPATLYATARTLRAEGYEVVEATTGTQALEKTDSSIDLVVLDVQLPDIHGFDVCRQLRDRGDTALIPVIHLSATFRTDRDRVHGLDSGADGYLTHPIEPLVLVATINSLLRTRRAEEAHRGSEARFRQFFQVSPVGMGLLDESGALLECNPALCELLSLASEALVSRPFADFAIQEERLDLERALAASPSGPPSRYFRLKRNGGLVASVELRIADLPDSTLRLAMVTDITEQRKYEAEREQLLASERAARTEAERLNALKDQFIAVLGHELRNPLAAIVTGIEALSDQQADTSRREWVRENIARSAQHLKSLINDLLDTTRLTHGKLSLKKKSVDLTEVVRQAVYSCRPLIESRSHELSVSIEPEDIKLYADPLRLEQVIVNLLTNAAHYTPSGGRVRVEAKRVGDQVELTVADTGQGLTEDQKTHIFEAFEQAGRSGHGLGLGLTLVRQLVDLHGGEVTADSEGPGRGATFFVRLPLNFDACAVDADGPAARPGAVAPVRTLIVDDNESAALMLQMLLQQKKFTAEVAFTGGSALQTAQRFRPELVLLDIGLPDMSGYEVARRLRQEGLAKATIVAVSGYAKAAGGDAVFDTHLVKPATLADIQELAASVAARREEGESDS